MLKNLHFGDIKASVADATANAALKAASVAKTFQSLDQMADDDEYIKSEGLNVTRNQGTQSQGSPAQGEKILCDSQSKNHEPNAMGSLDRQFGSIYASSMDTNDQKYGETAYSSYITQPHTPLTSDCCSDVTANGYAIDSVKEERLSSTVREESLPTHQRDFYVHESVSALMGRDAENEMTTTIPGSRPRDNALDIDHNQGLLEEKEISMRHFDLDDSYTSSDDDSDDDSIHAVVKPRGEEKERHHDNTTVTKRNKNSGNKDPNRFFADLDARLAAEATTCEPSSPCEAPSSNLKSKPPLPIFLESFLKPGQNMEWMRSVLPPKMQQSFAKMVVLPVVVHDGNDDQHQLKKKKGSFKVAEDDLRSNIVSSTDISFGIDEAKELERLEQKMKGGIMQVTLDTLMSNRYLMYIFLPFLVASAFYFMIWKKTDESVTLN